MSQQTASAQEPDRHSDSAAHASRLLFRQVPALDPVLVSAQTEPVGHDAEEQHTLLPTPATQWPLAHWESFVHSVPRPPVVRHAPALHPYPVAQSADVAQTVLHTVVLSQM